MSVLLVLTGMSMPAFAAGNTTVTIKPMPAGSEANHDGKPVYEPGKPYSIEFGYANITPSAVVRVKLPTGVTIPEGVLKAGSDNEAVESFTLDGDDLIVTFKDIIPEELIQGNFGVGFQVDQVDKSTVVQDKWVVGDVSTPVSFIIKKPGDSLATVKDGLAKTASQNMTWPEIGIDKKQGRVVMGPEFLDVNIPFTVVLDSKDIRNPFVLTDSIPNGLKFAGVQSASVVSWDANGLNKTDAAPISVGANVSGNTVTLTGSTSTVNTKVTITYNLQIANAAALESIRLGFQKTYDERNAANATDLSTTFTNSVKLESSNLGTKTASVTLGTNVAGIGAFGKRANLAPDTIITFSDEEKKILAQPVPLTYDLTVNLAEFSNYEGGKYALDRNVVISDKLPKQMSWRDGDTDFLTGYKLDRAEGFDGDATDFARNEFVGQYAVVKGTLFINLGNKYTTDAKITVKAQVNSLEGIRTDHHPDDQRTVEDRYWGPENVASFTYSTRSDVESITKAAGVTLVTERDRAIPLDDDRTFTKRNLTPELQAKPGTPMSAKYRFEVKANVGDARLSKIVDEIDHDVFNVTEETLAKIQASIKVGGRGGNGDSTIVAVLADNGNLEFVASPAFKAGNDFVNAAFSVEVDLPIKTLFTKEDVVLKNAASYEGASNNFVYTSEFTSSATSFGNELEVQKSVLNPTSKEFGKALRAEVDANGKLVNDTYIYRVSLVPHGTFKELNDAVTDVLPKGVEFQGFVAENQVKADKPTYSTDKFIIPGSQIEASFDSAKNTVVLAQGKLPDKKAVTMYFMVKITDYNEGVAITNKIGRVAASIVPTNAFPVNINKISSADPEIEISDANAKFEVRNEAGDVVVDNVFVADGRLVVKKNDATVALTVPTFGKYTVVETRAPKGYLPSTASYAFELDKDGVQTPAEVNFVNDPTAPSVSVGNFVWVDTNRDGIQDEGEPGIPGVKLSITDANGNAVTDVFGNPVGTQTTDADGKYLFENLPAGKAYTVTIVQNDEGTKEALKPYVPTLTGQGNRDNDSSTEHATSNVLPNGGDEDLSLDFGFVSKTYAIGDYVWIDLNRNGIQDATESPLAGVTVTLTDADGKELGSTTTDAAGKYLFDNLAAGTYRVQFVLTEEQAKLYVFTKTGAENSTGANDSNAGEQGWTSVITLNDENASLTKTYPGVEIGATEGIDPTWDAGVVRKSVSVGDLVWADTNRDGLQDDNEPGIPGVVLSITGPDGAVTNVFGEPVGNATTDENGNYSFDDLPALPAGQHYTVSIVYTDPSTKTALEHYTPTTPGDGKNGAKDSSTDTATSGDLVNDGDRDDTLDFGFVRKSVSVGDFVWVDTNRDGIQQPGEPGIPGVKLELVGPNGSVTNVNGEPVEPTVTDENGWYTFDGLPALPAGQHYTVKIMQDDEGTKKALEPYIPTKENIGDSKTDSSTWEAESGDLVNDGEHDETLDFGFVRKSVSVGDFVWVDFNRDGLQTPGEPGIPGVKLELVGPNGPVTDVFGKPVEPTVTNEDGFYEFIDLPALQPGEKYTVKIVRDDEGTKKALEIYTPTDAGKGTDTAKDSSTWTADSGDLVKDGDRDDTLDFGFIRKAVSVGDFVWVDTNRDGIQQPGEPGIPGVKLELVGPNGPVTDIFGKPVEPTVTGANGEYSFDNLPALGKGEHYTVKIVRDDAGTIEALKPYTPTKPGQGKDREKDSSSWEAVSGPLVNNGDRDSSLDFGFVTKSYAIGDYVWIDTNKNGVQDANEKPLPGVGVILTDAAGKEIARTTTDKAGRYVFDNLAAGTYKVRFELTEEQAKLYEFTTLNADGEQSGRDSDADHVTGWTREIVLGDDNASLTHDYTAFRIDATEGIDPTWDAGVVLKPTGGVTTPSPDPSTDPSNPPTDPSTEPGNPTDPGTSVPPTVPGKPDGLSSTGADAALLWGGGAAALLLLAGGALLLGRSRREQQG
ncbi:SdrD B-like domain-containing protein [Mycetocola tolaasinivorans]|uniref:SdrD B-like domain-containing protein n=1 Tax=Mycetocola tolaasinivorans TaxID=76635 RepID=UPI0016047AF1|nr:SdrD B-like domain-containing protein [Mycetocola tolaasinivorans]